MNSSQIRTLMIIVLIQAIAMISWAAIQEKPMKKRMSFILNDVLNANLQDVNQLETSAVHMKNYQLFVYVGSGCQTCQATSPELQKLASDKSKLVNVILVYDYGSQSALSQKDAFAQTSTYEFFDQKGYMYHYLFTEPQYLSFVLTGPKHTIISEGRIQQADDLEKLKPLISNN